MPRVDPSIPPRVGQPNKDYVRRVRSLPRFHQPLEMVPRPNDPQHAKQGKRIYATTGKGDHQKAARGRAIPGTSRGGLTYIHTGVALFGRFWMGRETRSKTQVFITSLYNPWHVLLTQPHQLLIHPPLLREKAVSPSR